MIKTNVFLVIPFIILFNIGLPLQFSSNESGAGQYHEGINKSSLNGDAQWSIPQQIPDFDPRTWSPILVADQNQIVHAFSSQWIGESSRYPKVAIFYNQWSINRGWSKPFDILLPPLKNQARVLDARLDNSGVIHIIFYSGDNVDANIYYSKAPATDAYLPSAWTSPKIVGNDASEVQSAAFSILDNGNIYLLYVKGNGENRVYSSVSSDNGDTWSTAQPISPISASDLIPASIQLYKGQSGTLHAIWNMVTPDGQGRTINYSHLDLSNFHWSDPIELENAQSGYGTNTPNIIEQKGEVLAVYNLALKIYMRKSNDNGKTWGKPIILFPKQIGVNGSLSMQIDGNGLLHMFFGQRIPGTPDIHGMWHSTWQNETWSDPEAIISGPRNLAGNSSFDPFDAHAVINNGNMILVTWRTDPGNGVENENGVWYSYKSLGVSQLSEGTRTSTASSPTKVLDPTRSPTATIQPVQTPTQQDSARPMVGNPSKDPNIILMLSIIPTFLLISIVAVWYLKIHNKRNY